MPAVFTLPVFILATSIMYSTAALPQIAANPTLNEMFISMAASGMDIAPTLPIAIGVVSLLSLEVGTWGPRNLRSMRKIDPKDVQLVQPAGKPSTGAISKQEALELKPNAIATGFFRFLSFVRVPICVALPGTVNIYWFTSTFFGLLESGLFTLIERSRAPKYWGRNSPLLGLSPAVLKARGIDLSTRTPLERAGITYTPQMGKPKPKEALSLERAARATFIAGLRASQALKRVPSAISNIGSFRRKATASSRTLGRYYTSAASDKWTKMRSMKSSDYWKEFGEWRSRSRERNETRWMRMAKWLVARLKKAQIENRKLTGELPTRQSTVQWGTKAQRRIREKERNRIRYMMMAEMNQTAAFKAKQRKEILQASEFQNNNIPGLQPPRVKRKPSSTKAANLFAN